MINARLPGIRGNTVANLVRVISGSDLIHAVNPDDICSIELPTRPTPQQASFLSLTWHASIPKNLLTARRVGPMEWFTAPQSVLLSPSCWKGSSVHPIGTITRIPGNLPFPTSASSAWEVPCQIGTWNSLPGWSNNLPTVLLSEEKVNNQSSLARYTGANMNTWRSKLEAMIRSKFKCGKKRSVDVQREVHCGELSQHSGEVHRCHLG